jgi:hypothetical protein
MVVETPRDATTEPATAKPPDAGVIKDARSRQRRHHRAGACLLLAGALAAVIASNSGGGGGTAHGKAPAAHGRAGLVQGAEVRLPRGQSTTTFTITAPAAHAYDVTVAAPAAAAIVLTMKISAATGWTLNTLHDPGCHTMAGRTGCVLHFAEGGNPGGRWTAIVHKTSLPAARGRITIAFDPNNAATTAA